MTRQDEYRWLENCAECVLWLEETDLPIPQWLIRDTRKIGRRNVARILSDEGLGFARYESALFVAEISGVA